VTSRKKEFFCLRLQAERVFIVKLQDYCIPFSGTFLGLPGLEISRFNFKDRPGFFRICANSVWC